MNFQELLNQCDWDEIWSHIILNYEDQSHLHDAYHRVYKKLCVIEGVESSMRIIVAKVVEDDGDTWIDVSGVNGTTYRESEDYVGFNLNESILDKEVKYALEFTDWQKWLLMEIDSENFTHFNNAEIAAHCLWELTFIGFDESEVDAVSDHIKSTVEGVKNGTIEVMPFDIDKSIDESE